MLRGASGLCQEVTFLTSCSLKRSGKHACSCRGADVVLLLSHIYSQ